MASGTQADRDADPEPAIPTDEFDDLLKGLGLLLIFLIAPPVFLYREYSVEKRFWLWRYFYTAFGVGALIMFAPQLLQENYGYLLLAPVFHLVALYAVGGPLLLTVVRSRDVSAAGLASVSVPAPEGLIVPGFEIAAVGTGVVLILVGAVVSTYGRPASLKWKLKHVDLGPNEFVVPLDPIKQLKDGAPRLPVLVATVSTLILGETGAGKTATIHRMLDQVPFGNEIATVVHDFKDDYLEYFRERGIEVILLSIEGSDVIWNMFLDVRTERHYREIAAAMMGEPEGRNPFRKPATSVLRAAMVYLHRQGKTDETTPTHADLAALVNKPMAELHGLLDEAGIQGAEQIDPEVNGATNVYNDLLDCVSPLFAGDFGKAGSFSLREWAENPAGRVLIVSNRAVESETLGPMLRLVLDEAIRHSMDTETETNYILDELDQLPRLKRLSTAASAGRDEGVRVLIGIQTIGQLRARYGKHTNGILGNCVQGIYLGPGESETVEYILDSLGKYRRKVTSRTRSNSGSGRSSSAATTRERELSPITSGELRDMDSGDVVIESRSEWWIGKIPDSSRIRKWL